MTNGYALVIGSMGIEIKAFAPAPLGAVNPGQVRNSLGGGARNIAENLARLDVPTVLLSAVGSDGPARRLIRWMRKFHVDTRHVRVVADGRTANFVSLVDEAGEPTLTIHDTEIMTAVDSNYLWKHEPLFEKAAVIVIDATLNEEALATAFEIAARYHVRVCADPTSPTFAAKLRPHLAGLFLVTPNAAEAAALCDQPAEDRDSALEVARKLVTLGTMIAVVTLGEQGAAYAHSGGSGFIRAVRTKVIDPTGAGDAFTGAVIFGLLNDVAIDEAMRLGMTAAALTLQVPDTVFPGLTQELLYDKLVV
ncbi:MAG: carbohydrate kinase family protein [Anaerolinea sp.]|nr:carbohydrate kinase family protein [Anaerolinea sp.]